MLILTRKRNEKIIMGQKGEIDINILEIKRGQVSLGITAPPDIPVNRQEIWEKKKGEKI